MITHIVVSKLKNKSDAEKVRDKILEMQGKIPQIRYMEVGIDIGNSPKSWDVALYSKFDSMETLQEYLTHPLHVEVSEFNASLRESMMMIDYES